MEKNETHNKLLNNSYDSPDVQRNENDNKKNNDNENNNTNKVINNNTDNNANNQTNNQDNNQANNQDNNQANNQTNKQYINNKYLILGALIIFIAIFINWIINWIIYQNKLINNLTKQNKDILEINKNLTEEIKKNEKIDYNIEPLRKPIIGIDFGSTFSGFSILIMKNNKKEIEDKKEYFYSSKIILNKKTEEVEEIGEKTIDSIKSNKKNDYIYFENIKKNLDPKKSEKNEEIETNFPIKYKIKLETVIKEYLKKISDISLKELNNKGHNYTKNEIKWVVTVPAIWNEHGKQFMKNCAKKAGMKDILISLEPEAASLNMFDDPNIVENLKKKDKNFLLIDAGGYTVDITLNQIVDRFRNLKQLSPPSGGSYGSMNINLEIIKILEEIFGKDIIDKFKMKQTNYWGQLRKMIEENKQAICVNDADNEFFEIYNYFSSFFSFGEKVFETKYGTIKYDKNKIYIPNSLIKKIITNQVDKIINHIKKLLKEFNKIKIDQFVLTGGFSNCNILKNNLIENFKPIVVNQLTNPERSIARGAALYALKPNQIISRVAPYSIGLNTYDFQRSGTECKRETKDDNNKTLCDYYDPFITKGEDIKNNLIINRNYIPLHNNQTSIGFNLYYSNLYNPIYIDENVKKLLILELKQMKHIYKEKKEKLKLK